MRYPPIKISLVVIGINLFTLCIFISVVMIADRNLMLALIGFVLALMFFLGGQKIFYAAMKQR